MTAKAQLSGKQEDTDKSAVAHRGGGRRRNPKDAATWQSARSSDKPKGISELKRHMIL